MPAEMRSTSIQRMGISSVRPSPSLCKPYLEQTHVSHSDSIFAVFDLSCHWYNPADDALITRFSLSILETIDQRSKAAGLYYPFVFLNDAGPGESPFVTYGKGKSLSTLRHIRQQYDPTAVFQRLMPGGFKLGVL